MLPLELLAVVWHDVEQWGLVHVTIFVPRGCEVLYLEALRVLTVPFLHEGYR